MEDKMGCGVAKTPLRNCCYYILYIGWFPTTDSCSEIMLSLQAVTSYSDPDNPFLVHRIKNYWNSLVVSEQLISFAI